jgi:molybdate transport system substrate-binding protein
VSFHASAPWVVLCAALTLAGCERSGAHRPPPIRVAAAADLTAAFGELGRDFERATGQQLTFSFGSTGLLARQLAQGAPFDVFVAAGASFVDDVVAAGACDGATRRPYARGRLALWSKRGRVEPARSVAELSQPRFTRVAIAHPEHAPYGRAAREALSGAEVWDEIAPRLVFGENVRQALQFAESGNVEAALVALALVIHDGENPWVLVPERLHRPIDQVLVVCRHGTNRAGAEAFARHVTSEEGREVMDRFGFLPP